MQRATRSSTPQQQYTSEVPGTGERKPRAHPFYQQRLPAWQPVLTPNIIYLVLTCTGALFIALGIALLVASNNVVELRAQYDGPNTPSAQSSCSGVSFYSGSKFCTISFVVPSAMKAPVYVYYELTNFYQNHRRYVQSRSFPQTMGTIYTDSSSLAACDPLRVNPATGKVLHPCGLIANSFFNDTFCPSGVTCGPFGAISSNTFGWSESNIAWPTDKATLFVPVTSAQRLASSSKVQFLNDTYPNLYCGINGTGGLMACDPSRPLDVDNEHFIVWMRPAALPEFRKLYGRFSSDIPAGTTLTFNVISSYPVSIFSGTKALVVTTLSWAGAKNSFLGIAYLVVGSACFAVAVMFFVRQRLCKGRELGDASALIWGARR